MLVSFVAGTPLVIYNASGSAPLGFYYLAQRLPGKGELAVLRPTPAIELLLLAHDIMPAPVPLLKQVAATASDDVCRSNEPPGTISINGKVLAEVQAKDRAGRPLPTWDGCVHLVDGEYFLLQPHPFSFDSRYFGPVLRCDILGVAFPIWIWNPDG
ncbi:S26 family signal peptidase [Bradyrhizobium sp. WSM 1704]|uniref:S26 family signal peptidase n=1 Tax=Bradyrhizobium semiaridum TaxID=2821404 RepID=UPI00201B9AB2|nr:S26 family signal peptidase [Bradyrhizobium semiaridum]MCA6121273.1 S26 family signal peptidase [Bradyrhizobium semiaridum]